MTQLSIANIKAFINIALWIVRVLILSSLIPVLPKMIEAKRDEDERQFNKSIVLLIMVIVVFVVSFPIGNLITSTITSVPGVK